MGVILYDKLQSLAGSFVIHSVRGVAWAVDISGQWTADWADYGGDSRDIIRSPLSRTERALTGAIKSEGGELQIREGKVNGDDVSFVLAQKLGTAK